MGMVVRHQKIVTCIFTSLLRFITAYLQHICGTNMSMGNSGTLKAGGVDMKKSQQRYILPPKSILAAPTEAG
jgi:hypothetical protein